MRAVLSAVVLGWLCACGGAVTASAETEHAGANAAPNASTAASSAQSDARGDGTASASAAPSAVAAAPSESALEPPPEPAGAGAASAKPGKAGAAAVRIEAIDAGEIPRPALRAVLAQGIGRFLQRVRAEARLVGGRFAGWRIVSLLIDDPAPDAKGLQPGDTVLRVNGQSIERPEQFKTVWDSLATQSELVLLVERAGKQSELRWRIVER